MKEHPPTHHHGHAHTTHHAPHAHTEHPKKVNCVGHGEVEVVKRGDPQGLSTIKLSGGATTTVPTSYLDFDKAYAAKDGHPKVVKPK